MRGHQPGLPLVSEPVALAADVEHVAVMQQPVEDGRGGHGVTEELTHSAKPLLDVRMMLPLSYLAETRLKKAVADSRS